MKKRNLFLTLGLALGLGVGVAAGLGARGLEAKEVEAVSNGDLFVIQGKSGWDAVSGNYTLEFSDDSTHTKIVSTNYVLGNDNGKYFHFYEYQSSDFSFTPTKVKVVKGSNYSDKFTLASFNTIWVPDTPSTSGGGTYSASYTATTMTASFHTAAPEGQQVFVGLDAANWKFVSLLPNNDRTVYTYNGYRYGTVNSVSYKLLTAEQGEAQSWDHVIKDNGSGDNASVSISNNNFALTTDDHYFDVQYYTVTKKAVLDGVVQDTPLGSDQVVQGQAYAVPSRPTWAGYHFNGWYKDSTLETPFTAAFTPEANINVYAKFTILVNDSYVYYVTGSTTATTNYIYSFGGDTQFGGGTGTAITSVATEIHGVVNFQGTEQLIYKIPYSTTAADTHIIINKNAWGEGNQTSDMPLVSHSAYWFTTDEDYHNDDAGAALDFILALEAKRDAVVAAGDIKADSICGISAEDAATLCSAYNALTQTQRETYVDVSDVWTYKRTDSSQNDHVTIYDIMEELASRAGGVALNGHSAKVALFGSSTNYNNNTAMIILLVSVIGLVAVGSIFVIRRRKENN